MDFVGIIIWIIFIFFFILAIIFIFLYFSNLPYLISPSQCLGGNTAYSVDTGKTGPILQECYGLGANPASSACSFSVNSLYSAFQLCNNNPQSCQVFSFDGQTVDFLEEPLSSSTDPTTIVYIKNY